MEFEFGGVNSVKPVVRVGFCPSIRTIDRDSANLENASDRVALAGTLTDPPEAAY